MSTFHGGQTLTPLCITAKGVNYVKKYLGENINHQDVKNTILEITFNNQDYTPTNEDLNRWVQEIDVYDRIGSYGTLYIPTATATNDVSAGWLTFDRARIIKAEFPTSPNPRETGVGWGKIILAIEQKLIGDLTSLAGHPDYVDLTTIPALYWELIEDIQEDWLFSYGQNGEYSYTQNVSVKVSDRNDASAVSPATDLGIAQTIAYTIINATPVFGFSVMDTTVAWPPSEDGGAWPLHSCADDNPDSSVRCPHGAGGHSQYGKRYISEVWDTLNNTVSYSKTFETTSKAVFLPSGKRFNYDMNHQISMDRGGIVTITENATIHGIDNIDVAFVAGKEAVEALLNGAVGVGDGAYSRCFYLFSQATDPLITTLAANAPGTGDPWEGKQPWGLTNSTGANNQYILSHRHKLSDDISHPQPVSQAQRGILQYQPVDITRGHNAITNECRYTVSYTNDPAMQLGFQADRTLTLSTDATNISNINENVTLTTFRTKGPMNLTHYTTDSAGSNARITAFFGQVIGFPAAGNWAHTKSDVSYKPLGKNITYSLEYTSNNRIYNPAKNGLKKLDITINDTYANRMHGEYVVPRAGIVVHQGINTQLGIRSVSANALMQRVAGTNELTNPTYPAGEIAFLAGEVRAKLLLVFAEIGIPVDDVFLTNVDFEFSSDRQIKFNAEVNYVGTKGDATPWA